MSLLAFSEHQNIFLALRLFVLFLEFCQELNFVEIIRFPRFQQTWLSCECSLNILEHIILFLGQGLLYLWEEPLGLFHVYLSLWLHQTQLLDNPRVLLLKSYFGVFALLEFWKKGFSFILCSLLNWDHIVAIFPSPALVFIWKDAIYAEKHLVEKTECFNLLAVLATQLLDRDKRLVAIVNWVICSSGNFWSTLLRRLLTWLVRSLSDPDVLRSWG